MAVPRWKRGTSRRNRPKGGDQRTDQTRKGTTQTPGWHPEETASQLPQQDAQKPWGVHPSCGRPAGYLPSGTVDQWPPDTGQWWNVLKGGDPRTDHKIEGADSELPGWQPTETASQLPLVTKRYSRTSVERGWHQRTKRRGAQGPQCAKGDPKTLASRRHWLLQVVAATAGATHTVIVFWLMSPFGPQSAKGTSDVHFRG